MARIGFEVLVEQKYNRRFALAAEPQLHERRLIRVVLLADAAEGAAPQPQFDALLPPRHA